MIREIKKEDREKIIRLIRATKNFSDAEVTIAEELIDICIDIQSKKIIMLTSRKSGTHVAGFLLLGPTPATVGTYDMYWIAVDPEFQGHGIAQGLDELRGNVLCESANGYLLIAETSSQPSYERTRAFYASRIMKCLRKSRDYYKPGDDLVIFGKVFVAVVLSHML